MRGTRPWFLSLPSTRKAAPPEPRRAALPYARGRRHDG
ncbi:hypothetical protein DA2_1987 [Desulfovibrio sp. A2]|nr:hypothetical protein DA2_1987 [Desulfovibrio sp. A2]